ncbi:MAG: NAD-dependent protein deacetylase [Thermoanaerobaculia bacterium]
MVAFSNLVSASTIFSGETNLARLRAIVGKCRRLLVLTGAGCSTESGIPDYRDADGKWKKRRPVYFQEFIRSHEIRQYYWARSFRGWPEFSCSRPNSAHAAIAALETQGIIGGVITQNVDRLHQKAGSRRVIDLHGRLDRVLCLDCGARSERDALQKRLEAMNSHFQASARWVAPDGDAELSRDEAAEFQVAECTECGGMLKPDVVFFGENVPLSRVEESIALVEAADALLVAGSSLMVWSGYRFVRAAAARGLPIAIVNRGLTRADALATVKVSEGCGSVLSALI